MTPDPLADALIAAGFAGVERDGAVIYARDGAEAPEFTLSHGTRFALRFPVRADQTARDAWMRAHPAGRLDIVEGETCLSMALPDGADLTAALALWRDLMRAASQAAVEWRRRERPLHGM